MRVYDLFIMTCDSGDWEIVCLLDRDDLTGNPEFKLIYDGSKFCARDLSVLVTELEGNSLRSTRAINLSDSQMELISNSSVDFIKKKLLPIILAEQHLTS